MNRFIQMVVAFIMTNCIALCALADASTFSSLARDDSIAWSGQPLRPGLARLAESFEVAIWLDRRVDPTMRLEVAGNGTRYQLLQRIAEVAGIRVVIIPGIVIFARPQDADRIASAVLLMRDIARNDSIGKRLLIRKDFQWADVANPRQIMRDAAAAWKVDLESDWIPHDLWPAYTWQQIDGVAVLALVATSFDRMPRFNSSSLTWETLPDRIATSATYRSLTNLEPLKEAVLARDKNAKWNVASKNVVTLESTAAAHEVVLMHQAQNTAGRSSPKSASTKNRYSLQVRNQPARKVIAQIAMAEKWTLDWQGSTERGDKLITLNATDQLASELIREVCQQADLEFVLDQGQLQVKDR